MDKIDKILMILCILLFASLIGSSISASITVSRTADVFSNISSLLVEQTELNKDIAGYLKIISDRIIRNTENE
ncbi:MAG: hypothetical protein PVF17_12815 [Ignavibacteria bacterium]|jgi:hypothetical protein